MCLVRGGGAQHFEDSLRDFGKLMFNLVNQQKMAGGRGDSGALSDRLRGAFSGARLAAGGGSRGSCFYSLRVTGPVVRSTLSSRLGGGFRRPGIFSPASSGTAKIPSDQSAGEVYRGPVRAGARSMAGGGARAATRFGASLAMPACSARSDADPQFVTNAVFLNFFAGWNTLLPAAHSFARSFHEEGTRDNQLLKPSPQPQPPSSHE